MDANLSALVERFLFGNGQQLSDYFVEKTPVSELLCYRNAEGRLFDIPINDEALAQAVSLRLRELGVDIVLVE